ncbi:hypothetical protein [Zongyangia hominis]|uniref:Uncharacterized protein n=1 Tax=Zongyangia hominis TaxID=2763677 RepID=A0A926IAN0_9FIRM|nr:hypothetical protein [Zongyangia hominis]MBC8569280.1 hypothetical protein [Zongyangia hominis]
MRIEKESRLRGFLSLSMPLWIPPILFALYYPLFTYVLAPNFGDSLTTSVVPGVSANDFSYIYFAVVFVICLIAQVILKERLLGFWRKALYLLVLILADAGLCWVFLQMLLLK